MQEGHEGQRDRRTSPMSSPNQPAIDLTLAAYFSPR